LRGPDMKRLFLFDFDGVVVDSLELYEHSVNLCLEKLGLPPFRSRQEFLRVFEDNFYEGIGKKGVDVPAFTKVSAELAPSLDYSKVTPVRELEPVLENLSKRHTLAIVSSNSNYAIERILSGIGYGRFFDEILGSDFMFSKVEKIRHITERSGMQGNGTFYIGDTVGDILEAKQAGVKTVAVTWGWHTKEQLSVANPDSLIDSPEELLEII